LFTRIIAEGHCAKGFRSSHWAQDKDVPSQKDKKKPLTVFDSLVAYGA
jgi:hypothetical protein